MNLTKSYHIINFGSTGPEYVLGDNTEDTEIENNFVNTIATYYSIILQQSRDSEKSFFGPFPVSQLPNYLLYIFKFNIKDSKATDERVLNKDNKTTGLLLWFVPIDKYGDVIVENYLEIESTFTEWGKRLTNQDINKLDPSVLSPLKTKINNIVELNKGTCLERNQKMHRLATQIKHQFVLLHDLYKKEFSSKIALYFHSDDMNIIRMLRDVLLSQTSPFLQEYVANDQDWQFIYEGIDTELVFNNRTTVKVARKTPKHVEGVIYIITDCDKASDVISSCIKQTDKTTILSFVFLPNCGVTEIDLEKSGIYDLITKKKREIMISDLNENPDLLSAKILQFIEKVIKRQINFK